MRDAWWIALAVILAFLVGGVGGYVLGAIQW